MVATQERSGGLVSLPKTGDRLGLDKQTVRKLVRLGEIPSVKLGARRYVAASVIERMLAGASIETRNDEVSA